MRLYFVKLYTYSGVVAYATHWWANVNTNKGDWTEKVYDNITKLYKSRESALNDAVNWFRRERLDGYLIEGNMGDPAPVLCGPRKVRDRANAINRAAEACGRWEGDEKKMEALCKKWDRLWEEEEEVKPRKAAKKQGRTVR